MMGAKNLPVMAYRLMQVVAFGIAVVASSFAQSSSQSMGLPDLLKAAESGDAGAQTELGRRYEYGLGVPEDHLAAAKWFRKAAEQGNAKAQLSLGFSYNLGLTGAANQPEAFRWFRKAAD